MAAVSVQLRFLFFGLILFNVQIANASTCRSAFSRSLLTATSHTNAAHNSYLQGLIQFQKSLQGDTPNSSRSKHLFLLEHFFEEMGKGFLRLNDIDQAIDFFQWINRFLASAEGQALIEFKTNRTSLQELEEAFFAIPYATQLIKIRDSASDDQFRTFMNVLLLNPLLTSDGRMASTSLRPINGFDEEGLDRIFWHLFWVSRISLGPDLAISEIYGRFDERKKGIAAGTSQSSEWPIDSLLPREKNLLDALSAVPDEIKRDYSGRFLQRFYIEGKVRPALTFLDKLQYHHLRQLVTQLDRHSNGGKVYKAELVHWVDEFFRRRDPSIIATSIRGSQGSETFATVLKVAYAIQTQIQTIPYRFGLRPRLLLFGSFPNGRAHFAIDEFELPYSDIDLTFSDPKAFQKARIVDNSTGSNWRSTADRDHTLFHVVDNIEVVIAQALQLPKFQEGRLISPKTDFTSAEIMNSNYRPKGFAFFDQGPIAVEIGRRTIRVHIGIWPEDSDRPVTKTYIIKK